MGDPVRVLDGEFAGQRNELDPRVESALTVVEGARGEAGALARGGPRNQHGDIAESAGFLIHHDALIK